VGKGPQAFSPAGGACRGPKQRQLKRGEGRKCRQGYIDACKSVLKKAWNRGISSPWKYKGKKKIAKKGIYHSQDRRALEAMRGDKKTPPGTTLDGGRVGMLT